MAEMKEERHISPPSGRTKRVLNTLRGLPAEIQNNRRKHRIMQDRTDREKYNELSGKIQYLNKSMKMQEPEITDHEYDLLMQELKENREKEHPEYITEDSPSQGRSSREEKQA